MQIIKRKCNLCKENHKMRKTVHKHYDYKDIDVYVCQVCNTEEKIFKDKEKK